MALVNEPRENEAQNNEKRQVEPSGSELFLNKVEHRLADALSSNHHLKPAVVHAVFAGGKRLRPLFARQFSKLTHPPETILIDACAAIELIHAASLVHDDILDKGMWRRGHPTVISKFGLESAVLVGDVLLCRSLAMLSAYPHEISKASAAFEELCHAAMMEWTSRRNLRLSFADWRHLAEGKTAALFGLSAYVAASLAGDRSLAARFEAAARHLGIAFQIADDLSDFFCVDVEKPSEDFVKDLADGTPSLPVLFACEQNKSLASEIEKWWASSTEKTPAPLLEHILTAGVRDRLHSSIRNEIVAAKEILGLLANEKPLQALFDWTMTLSEMTELGLPSLAARLA